MIEEKKSSDEVILIHYSANTEHYVPKTTTRTEQTQLLKMVPQTVQVGYYHRMVMMTLRYSRSGHDGGVLRLFVSGFARVVLQKAENKGEQEMRTYCFCAHLECCGKIGESLVARTWFLEDQQQHTEANVNGRGREVVFLTKINFSDPKIICFIHA